MYVCIYITHAHADIMLCIKASTDGGGVKSFPYAAESDTDDVKPLCAAPRATRLDDNIIHSTLRKTRR